MGGEQGRDLSRRVQSIGELLATSIVSHCALRPESLLTTSALRVEIEFIDRVELERAFRGPVLQLSNKGLAPNANGVSRSFSSFRSSVKALKSRKSSCWERLGGAWFEFYIFILANGASMHLARVYPVEWSHFLWFSSKFFSCCIVTFCWSNLARIR